MDGEKYATDIENVEVRLSNIPKLCRMLIWDINKQSQQAEFFYGCLRLCGVVCRVWCGVICTCTQESNLVELGDRGESSPVKKRGWFVRYVAG
jgi:hypothetical protein